jgi:hypothetical protein
MNYDDDGEADHDEEVNGNSLINGFALYWHNSLRLYSFESNVVSDDTNIWKAVMVPGIIPSEVKALQSGKQAGVIPRYQQALVIFLSTSR